MSAFARRRRRRRPYATANGSGGLPRTHYPRTDAPALMAIGSCVAQAPAPPVGPSPPSKRELAKLREDLSKESKKKAAAKKTKFGKRERDECTRLPGGCSAAGCTVACAIIAHAHTQAPFLSSRAADATIEADIEALEAAAAEAEAVYEEAKSSAKRLGQMELLALVSAASDARKAVDSKMERYLVLEEMMAEAGG